MQQPVRRLEPNVTVRRPPLVKPELDHSLSQQTSGSSDALPLTVAKREMMGRRAIDLQQLMANPRLRRRFTERFTPLPHGTNVDGMATVFAEAMLSTAAYIAPRTERSQEGRGGVQAMKRRQKRSCRGKRGKPREGCCAHLQATASSACP